MTTLYNPLVDTDPLALNYLTYGQVPIPLGPLIPSFFSNATLNNEGTTLNTNGLILSNNANTGYAGFTNYTVRVPRVPPTDLNSLTLEPVNASFPVLNAAQGFTVEFDLKVLQESSAAGRAGFSVLVVSNDPTKSLEIGFKEQGNSDRIFVQNALFGEGESSSLPLNINQTQTYWVSFLGNQYSIAANGVEILSGTLRDYVFNPTNSSPPLPTGVNPYEAKNLVFFGDNTDQAYAEFTLGRTQILPFQQDLAPDLYDDYLASYGDLIQAFGYDLNAARQHYSNYGFKEGRTIDRFSEGEYIASYDDLINAFGLDLRVLTLPFPFGDLGPLGTLGYNPDKVTEHYIRHGYSEGRRTTFQADEYLASYGDLIQAFGYNLTAATQHYIVHGSKEGRSRDLFDAAAYLNKYADLRAAFGSDLDAAAKHFVEYGFSEGRSWL